MTYTAANGSVLPVTGDDAYTSVALPFPVTHYGQAGPPARTGAPFPLAHSLTGP